MQFYEISGDAVYGGSPIHPVPFTPIGRSNLDSRPFLVNFSVYSSVFQRSSCSWIDEKVTIPSSDAMSLISAIVWGDLVRTAETKAFTSPIKQWGRKKNNNRREKKWDDNCLGSLAWMNYLAAHELCNSITTRSGRWKSRCGILKSTNVEIGFLHYQSILK